jgi:hypothetical protein
MRAIGVRGAGGIARSGVCREALQVAGMDC